jgi:hypothetical protein
MSVQKVARGYGVRGALGQGGIQAVYPACDLVTRCRLALKPIRDIPAEATPWLFLKGCDAFAPTRNLNTVEPLAAGELAWGELAWRQLARKSNRNALLRMPLLRRVPLDKGPLRQNRQHQFLRIRQVTQLAISRLYGDI